MRLKLVLISSLIAAIVGAGSAIAIILFALSLPTPSAAKDLLGVLAFLLPALEILLASVFVYRHTARRRKLQSVLTALIALLLTLGMLLFAGIR